MLVKVLTILSELHSGCSELHDRLDEACGIEAAVIAVEKRGDSRHAYRILYSK